MANALSLGLLVGGDTTTLQAQVIGIGVENNHTHWDGCDGLDALNIDDSLFHSAKRLKSRKKIGYDSLLYINQISDGAIFWHPLLTQEEASAIVQHKLQFGEILDASELVQCGFSTERVQEIRPFMVCDITSRWQKKRWLSEAKASKPSCLMGGKATLWTAEKATALGYQWQFRFHNPKTLSMGFSWQQDPGELGLKGTVIVSGKPPTLTDFWSRTGSRLIKNYHCRISDYRGLESLIIGRYSLQFGQGLVQGGLSGFWNAPVFWARRTPDWGLTEKRGWDEYQGHTGIALGFKAVHYPIRIIMGVSRERISARVDSVGRILGLITDGNFSIESRRGYQNNTRQSHLSVGFLWRGAVGLAWSFYGYDRVWLSAGDWPRPALRAGRYFHYPEGWFTRKTRQGGLVFFHWALQCSEHQPSQVIPTTRAAAVGGWIQSLGRQTDISIRGSIIEYGFKPPQGLFNQLESNAWCGSVTYSRGTTGKRSFRWAAELKQPLLPNRELELPLTYKQQFLIERRLSASLLFHCLWQWNSRPESSYFMTHQPYCGPSNTSYPTDFALQDDNAPTPFNQTPYPSTKQNKITLNLRNKPTEKVTVEHLLCFVPRPNSAVGSYLWGSSYIRRIPFSPLKWAAEALFFHSEIPLYFTPQTLPSEITHMTLTDKGLALNAIVQYTFKQRQSSKAQSQPFISTKNPSVDISSLAGWTNRRPIKAKSKTIMHPQFQLAVRSEIILKNTTENPVQPRIFVSLWLK